MTVEQDEDPFDNVHDLIEQLQTGNTSVDQLATVAEKIDLNKSDLEKFILDNQGTIIKDSVDVLQIMKQYVTAAPNAEDIGSFAELLKAASTAIDNLTKLHVSNQRTDTQVKIKQMDIDSKKQLSDDKNLTKLVCTREEIIKKMIEKSEVVDVTATEVDPEEGSST